MTFLRDNEGFSFRAMSLMSNPQRLSRRALALLLGLVSCSLTLVFTSPEAAYAKPPKKRKVAQISVGTAHLREKPGSKSKSKALLDHGDKARVVSRKGDWLKVRTESGREGWVRSDLVKNTKATFHDSSEDEERSSRRRSSSRSRSGSSRSASRHSSYSRTTSRLTAARKTTKPRTKSTTQIAAKSKGPTAAEIAAARKPFLRDSGLRDGNPRKTAVTTSIAAAPVSKTPIKVAVVENKPMPIPEESPETTIAVNVPESTSEEPMGAAETETPSEPEVVAAIPSSTPEPPTAEFSVTSETRDAKVVRGALSYRGTRYRMGATGRGAFDCSAFVRHVFAKEGKYLPRTAAEQYQYGRMVDKAELRPGDIVFFKNTYKRGISHVGIYIGNGRFVHASSGSGAVTTNSLSEEYYVNHWAGAKRLD